MKESILHSKSIDFAANIVNFYEDFLLLKKDNTIAKQLLRSATSIGANLNEATFGNSKADFISKLHIIHILNVHFAYFYPFIHFEIQTLHTFQNKKNQGCKSGVNFTPRTCRIFY